MLRNLALSADSDSVKNANFQLKVLLRLAFHGNHLEIVEIQILI